MVKVAAVFLLMGALANAAAIAGPEPAAFAHPESVSLFPRGTAELVANELGNVTDFSVPVTSEDVTGDPRGNDADETDLTKDLLDQNEDGGVTAFAASGISATTDKLLFRDSMTEFLRAKAARKPSNLIWTDDGCSRSPDRPSGFNFLDSYVLHNNNPPPPLSWFPAN